MKPEHEALVALYRAHCERCSDAQPYPAVDVSLQTGSFDLNLTDVEVSPQQVLALSEFMNDVQMRFHRFRRAQLGGCKPFPMSFHMRSCSAVLDVASSMLAMCRWLQWLEICTVQLADDGFKSIIAGLQQNIGLKGLLLRRCGVGSATVDGITILLERFIDTLEVFRFSNSVLSEGNRGRVICIEDIGVEDIRKMFSCSSALNCRRQKDSLSVQIGAVSWRSLLRSIRRQRHLTMLDLGGLVLKKDSINVMVSFLEDLPVTCPVLKIIGLPVFDLRSYDRVSWEAVHRAVAKFMESCGPSAAVSVGVYVLTCRDAATADRNHAELFSLPPSGQSSSDLSFMFPHFALETCSWAVASPKATQSSRAAQRQSGPSESTTKDRSHCPSPRGCRSLVDGSNTNPSPSSGYAKIVGRFVASGRNLVQLAESALLDDRNRAHAVAAVCHARHQLARDSQLFELMPEAVQVISDEWMHSWCDDLLSTRRKAQWFLENSARFRFSLAEGSALRGLLADIERLALACTE